MLLVIMTCYDVKKKKKKMLWRCILWVYSRSSASDTASPCDLDTIMSQYLQVMVIG